ncbi:MAG: LysR family transcriptional regulator [Dermatophilaceae bacterium]
MDPRLLEPFLAVVDEGSFVRAAARVSLSQPGLTHAMARLERQLGVRLFDRSTRRVDVTPAGAELVTHARRVLGDLARAEESVRAVASGTAGVVRLGVVGSAMADVVPRLVRRLDHDAPDVALQVVEAVGADQVGDLLDGRLDLAVVHARHAPPGTRLRLMSEEPLHVALPADHPLAARTVVRLVELATYPLVAIRREDVADTQHLYLEACRSAGFEPVAVREARSLQGLLGLVAAGAGWAFVAAPVLRGAMPAGVRIVDLRGVAQTLPVGVAWVRERLTPGARRVRELLAPPAPGHRPP